MHGACGMRCMVAFLRWFATCVHARHGKQASLLRFAKGAFCRWARPTVHGGSMHNGSSENLGKASPGLKGRISPRHPVPLCSSCVLLCVHSFCLFLLLFLTVRAEHEPCFPCVHFFLYACLGPRLPSLSFAAAALCAVLARELALWLVARRVRTVLIWLEPS